jgi:hypothetical protein
MITDKNLRQQEFTASEIAQYNNETRSKVSEYVNSMDIERLVAIAMDRFSVCPLCEQITQNQFINMGIKGECMSCIDDE